MDATPLRQRSATRSHHLQTEIIGGDEHRKPPLAGPLTLVIALAVGAAAVLSSLPALRVVVHAAGRAASGVVGEPDLRTWLLDLPAGARVAVQVDLAEVRPGADAVVHRLANAISFDDDVSPCVPPAASCSSSGSGLDGRWGVHLDARTTAFTFPSNRFLVYHEIGHAVWGLLLAPAARREFSDDVERALRGAPCVNDQGRPCAALTEMFADEFARYAGGFAASMSYYCTPPLLDDATFGRLVDAPRRAASPPSPIYLDRPAYMAGKIVTIRVRSEAADVREDRGISWAAGQWSARRSSR